MNGDGIGDLIIGAPEDVVPDVGEIYAGQSYVVFGSSGGFAASLDFSDLDGSNGFRLGGIDSSDQSGWSVSGAGDVNGDGIADLIIGARFADPDGVVSAGESYLVFGSSAGFAANLGLSDLDGSNGFRLDGIDGDSSGFSVSGAGDVNGDGIADLIIGAPSAGPDGNSGAGESYVVFGSTALGGPNDAPIAADDVVTASTTENVIDLFADNGFGIDFDPDLDSLEISAINGTPVVIGDQVTLPAGLTLEIDAAGKVIVTEAELLASRQEISTTFTYEVTDGRGRNVKRICADHLPEKCSRVLGSRWDQRLPHRRDRRWRSERRLRLQRGGCERRRDRGSHHWGA